MNVLIVHPCDDSRRHLRAVLEEDGFSVVETSAAPQALEACQQAGGGRRARRRRPVRARRAIAAGRPQGRPARLPHRGRAARAARRAPRRSRRAARAGRRRPAARAVRGRRGERPGAGGGAHQGPAGDARRAEPALRGAAVRGSAHGRLQPPLPAAPARPPDRGRPARRTPTRGGDGRHRSLRGPKRRARARGRRPGPRGRRAARCAAACDPRTTSGAWAATGSSRCCRTPARRRPRSPPTACAAPSAAAGLEASVSVGWATWAGEDAERLIERAGTALADAKEAGRDEVRGPG